jgi:hypothetical protein
MTRDAEDALREAFSDATFDRPVARIVAGAKRRRMRRRLSIGAVPALAVVAAGGTALLTSEKIWAGNVRCYGSADPKVLPDGSYSPVTTGERPEKLCAKEWREGYLPAEPILDRTKAPFPVPPLTACAIDDGAAVGVFPTDDEDFCTTGPVAREMHLSEVPDDFMEEMDRYVAMRDDAALRIRDAAIAAGGDAARACLDEDRVATVATEVLADHGYEGWTVTFEHSKHDAPCWMHVNFENAERRVRVYSTDRGTDEIWINDGAAFPEG